MLYVAAFPEVRLGRLGNFETDFIHKVSEKKKNNFIKFFCPVRKRVVMSLKYVQSVEGEGGDTV